jgi:hypothetical protein
MTKAEFFRLMALAIKEQSKHMILRYPVQLGDGTVMSIQASEFHYCHPRNNDSYEWESWEIGFPTQVIQELMAYVEDETQPIDTVYACVPTDVILDIINSRDGVLTILTDRVNKT